MAHEKWANKQIATAVSLGVSLANATKAAQWVLDHLPPGADPATYIFTASQMEQDISTPEMLQDARVDFYADENVPAQFKRIIDAGDANG
mgnify:CR=1 FL=1